MHNRDIVWAKVNMNTSQTDIEAIKQGHTV